MNCSIVFYSYSNSIHIQLRFRFLQSGGDWYFDFPSISFRFLFKILIPFLFCFILFTFFIQFRPKSCRIQRWIIFYSIHILFLFIHIPIQIQILLGFSILFIRYSNSLRVSFDLIGFPSNFFRLHSIHFNFLEILFEILSNSFDFLQFSYEFHSISFDFIRSLFRFSIGFSTISDSIRMCSSNIQF